MLFVLRLEKESDNEKLKGLFFNGEPLDTGKTVCRISGDEDDEFSEPNYDLYLTALKVMEEVGRLLPTARICYESIESEGTGESYLACKMENDPKIYECSTLWEDFDTGSDEWCEQVKMQSEEELPEEEEW